jgi:hypothetical protein
VRKEISQTIIAHLLNKGSFASVPELELHDLSTKVSLSTFKVATIAALKELPQHRFDAICKEAFSWLDTLSTEKFKSVLAEVAAIPAPLSPPKRINWSDLHHGAVK